MITTGMKTVIQPIRFLAIPLIAIVLLGALALCAPRSLAEGGIGSGGTPTGKGGTYNTDNGFGWKLFDVTKTQPGMVADMTQGSWSDVYTACKDIGKVWMFLIFDDSGTKGKEYKLYYYVNDANDNSIGQFEVDGSGHLYYNGHVSNGVYYANNYKGDKSENTVHGYFNKAISSGLISNPLGLKYGKDVGWFCYNTPWYIATSTTASTKVAEVGETVTWTHKVTNTGPNTTNKAIDWYYQNSGDWSGTGPTWTMATNKASGTGDTQTETYVPTLADFGKTLCRTTIASPKSYKSAESIESAPPECVLIGKKPKVQVMGGDVSVGRGTSGGSGISSLILTTQSTVGGSNYGSWGEYGLLASGKIEKAGSGASLKNGLAVVNQCSYSALSFANATAKTGCAQTTVIGNFTNTGSIPNVEAEFTNATTPYMDISDVQYKRVERASGDIAIPATKLQKGQWLVINAKGHKVTINGDITYTDETLTSAADIPQLVIIADTIDITASVGRVDAWLVATTGNGTINTCKEVNPGDKLSATMCAQKLTVNGPVMAKKLYLQRTAGANQPPLNDAAEQFNLRADAYVWSMVRATEGIHISINQTTELPPRF